MVTAAIIHIAVNWMGSWGVGWVSRGPAQVLDGGGIPVHEFFQTAARTGPATARFYQLVVDSELTTTETPLAGHVAKAILRETPAGPGRARRRRTRPARSTPPSWLCIGQPNAPATASRSIYL